MEHENVDETIAFQSACKKVRQIANTIKAIRIKYYPNFAKISDADKEAYDRLHVQINKIAEENGLNRLKAELIADIEDRYNNEDSQREDEQNNGLDSSEKLLKAYYGAIDAGQQALSEGKLKKALSCQRQADSFMEQLEGLKQRDLVQMAIHYKREKFGSLSIEHEKSNATNWKEFLKGTYRTEDLQERSNIAQEILQQAKEESREDIKDNTQEMLLNT